MSEIPGGESGFELGRAFVSVLPDASDFAQALDEEVGGLAVSVKVVPNASDFAAAVDEEIGGLSAIVPVTANTRDATTQVDSFIEDTEATSPEVAIGADTDEATAAVDGFVSETEAKLAAMSDEAIVVSLVPDVEDLEGALGDAGLTAPVELVPVMDDFQAALDGAAGGALSVSANADGAEAVDGLAASMDGLTGATEGATEALDGFDGAMAGSGGAISTLGAEVDELASKLDALAAGFGASVAGHLGEISGAASALEGALQDALGGQIGEGLEISVPVVPDMSGFDNALSDADVGAISVPVVPDTSDFDGALRDADVGAISVPTGPDMSMFEETAQAEADAMSVTMRVVPEGAGDSGLGDLGSQVDGVTQSSQEAEASVTGLDDALRATAADGAALGAVTEELDAVAIAADAATQPMATLRELTQDSFGSADYSAATQALSGVASAEELAAADAQSLQADLAELRTEIAGLEEEAATLDSSFLAWANSGMASEEQLTAIGAQMEELRNSIAGTAAEMGDYASALASGDAAIADADAQLGTFAGDIRAAESALGEATGTVTTSAASFLDMQAAAQRLGVSIEELPAALEAMDAQLAASDAARGASIASLNGEAGAMDAAAASAGTLAASEDAAAASTGILGGASHGLVGMMAGMFLDPLTGLLAFSAAVGAGGYMLADYENKHNDLIATLAKEDDATGYNISGYQKLADQLSVTGASSTSLSSSSDALSARITASGDSAGQFADKLQSVSAAQQQAATATDQGAIASAAVAIANKNATTSYESMHDGINNYATAIPAVTHAQQQAQQAATDLSAHLGFLETQYGLTQTQAEQLATAAGVSAKQLTGSGAAANNAMGKIEAYANANVGAAGPVNELNNDMSTFSNNALTATARVNALDQAFGLLVGNFVSMQQAELTVSQDFLTIASNAKQAGASMDGTNSASVTLQQSFYSTVPAIEQAANAMVKQGDSTQQVTTYIDQQITKLSGLTGGNQQAQTAVQGLKQWEDSLKTSTDASSTSLSNAAQALANQFTVQMENAGVQTSTAKADVDKFTTSLQQNGSTSSTTQADRRKLITDLENAGVSASHAKTLVDQFTSSVNKIPSSKQLNLVETATGTWNIQEALTGTTGVGGILPTPSGHAVGGFIRGGSGVPRADDIPALLSDKEYVISAPAVQKYGTGLFDSLNAMRYASGGIVGSYSGDPAGMGGWLTGEYNANTAAFTAALEASVPKQPKFASGGYVHIPHYAAGGSVWDAAAAGSAAGRQASDWAAIGTSVMQGQAINGASMPYATSAADRNISVNFHGITSFPNPEQIQAIQLALSAAVGVS